MRVLRGRRIDRLVAVLAAVLAGGTLVINQSWAAFSGTTSNGANSLAAGTVTLSDDDSSSLLFSVSGMKPGDTSTKCIVVSYTGSLTSTLKLYGSNGGTGLGTYIDLDVFKGSGGSFADCTGFTSSGQIFNDTLAAFMTSHTAFSNGLSYGSVTNPTSVTYKFVVTLQDNNSAQGLTAAPTFTWEAQNN